MKEVTKYAVFNKYDYVLEIYNTKADAEKDCDWENDQYVSEV